MEKGILKLNLSKKSFFFKTLLILISFCLTLSCSQISSDYQAVASRHHLATDIGMEVLNRGGNAVDAAVAVAFALAVVNPSAGNIGGGGFMLIHLAEKSQNIALDYRERAPLKSSTNMYLDDDGNVIKGLSLNSTLASGVPGTIAGLFYASEKFGSLKIESLIEPSIKLAKNGFTLSEFQSKNINKYKKKFKRNVDATRIFTRSGGFKTNDLLVQEDLGNTLERISQNGMSEFYSGQTARKISDFFNSNGGILSQADLLRYQVKESKSICGSYRVYKVCSMPPPSSGGIALMQMLNILENVNLSEINHNSEEYIKILISVMNYAFFDRAKYLGDSEFFNVPQKILTSKKYGKTIYDRILKNIKPNESNIIFSESEETTHFSVIDKWGNVVSNTYTLNTAYGSGIVPSGTGILMNNEMDDFSSKPGYPNAYGLVGSEANKIEPNKTPLSSMSPVIVFFEEKPFLVTGSPGGSTIITTVLQEILNIIDFQMTLNESSNKSRIHFQHLPDILFHEKIDDKIKSNLLLDRKLMNRKLGETHSILIKENIITAHSDKRRPDGKASTIHK